MTFEEKLKQLSALAAKLEDKSTGLDEGLKAYESAAVLIDECLSMLKEKQGKFEIVQKRIEEIVE